MYQRKGGLYLNPGEQLVAPGATQHIKYICGKYIATDSGMGIRDEKLGGNYFPAKTEYDGKLDLILLTHHHLDHSGNLPALVRDNPQAKVIMTRPTAMGAEIMLRDSLKIHETEQKNVRRAGGNPVPFVYSESDIHEMFKRMTPIIKPGWYEIWPGWLLGVYSAGHTRGAAMYFIITPEDTAYFITGDVCSHDQPVVKGVMLPPREFFGNRLDGKRIVMITETTYGDRVMSKSFDELWTEFGEFAKKKIEERIQEFYPLFSDRAPNVVKKLVDLGIHPHVDGMARDFLMLHSKKREAWFNDNITVKGDHSYAWCDQDIKLEIDEMIEAKKVILYQKLNRYNSQDEHRKEASHRLATAAGNCCGINYSPMASSSAMMDKGMSVRHAEQILPNRKGMVISTGYRFPNTVGEKIHHMKKGDTVKLTTWDPVNRREVEKSVPVSCEVAHFPLSAHDTGDKLLERVRLTHERFHPSEMTVIAHHGDAENVAGFMRRVEALNLNNTRVLHGKHMQEIQL